MLSATAAGTTAAVVAMEARETEATTAPVIIKRGVGAPVDRVVREHRELQSEMHCVFDGMLRDYELGMDGKRYYAVPRYPVLPPGG